MPVCFVPNCTSGYLRTFKKNKQEAVRNPSLFSTPKDPQLFDLWRKKIRRGDRPLGKNDKICSLHFRDSDIIKCDEVLLFDGTKYRSERKKWALKESAIPRLFSYGTAYLSDQSVSRKSTKNRSLPPDKETKQQQEQQIQTNDDLVQTEVLSTDILSEINNQKVTSDDLSQIVLPPLWTFSILPWIGMVVFLRWKADGLEIEKRIHITSDLEIKTFLYTKEIKLVEYQQVQSIDTVQNLIKIMDFMN